MVLLMKDQEASRPGLKVISFAFHFSKNEVILHLRHRKSGFNVGWASLPNTRFFFFFFLNIRLLIPGVKTEEMGIFIW